MTVTGTNRPRRIVVVSSGLSEPSQSRMLADRLAAATSSALTESGLTSETSVIELRRLAGAISHALLTHTLTPDLQSAVDQVLGADGVVTVSPTYKASYSGLFKSFWDLIDEDEFEGTPVLLGATGGTARHSLVIDMAMRPLFAFLKAVIAPISVFAASEDWGSGTSQAGPLHQRITRAGASFATLLGSTPAPSWEHTADEDEVIPFDQLLHG